MIPGLPAAAAPIDSGALSAFEQGLLHQRQGRSAAAAEAFLEACEMAPEFVDAHRAYQNVLLGQNRRGFLIRRYGQDLERQPDSASRRYLLARLWSDPHRQRDGFEEALAADPGLYFGYIGIGYASLELADLRRSEWAFRQAVRLEPTRLEGFHGLLRLLSARRDEASREERFQVASELLEIRPDDHLATRILLDRRLSDGDLSRACRDAVSFALRIRSAEAAQLAHDVLSNYATVADLERARVRLASVGRSPRDPTWIRLRLLVEERAGDPRGALGVLDRAPRVARRSGEMEKRRRQLLLQTGRLAEYLKAIRQHRYGAGLALAGDDAGEQQLLEIEALLEESAGRPAGERAATAIDSLFRMGLLEAGIALALDVLAADPDAESAQELLVEALNHRRFVAELNSLFEDVYREELSLSYDEAIDRIRALSADCFGRNVVDPVVTSSHFLIGQFLDPDPDSGCGLARHFDRFGAFVLIGQRTMAEAEAYILTRISAGGIHHAGRPIYRVVGEDLQVPSRTEFAGGEIAGFAFQTFIVLNADRARSTADYARMLWEQNQPEPAVLLEDPLLALSAGADADERTDLSEPLSLAARTTYRAIDRFLAAGGKAGEYTGVVLDAVEAHERAHIDDADRFLPLSKNLGSKFGLLWRFGFSPTRIEAWLEERAQGVALRDAASPLTVLASTVTMLPSRDRSPPHSSAYHDLTAELVERIDDRLSAYPMIDPGFGILAQLDRLGDDALRRLARSIVDSAPQQ